MFDYAIGHYQMHAPSKRLLASWVFSVVSHIAALLILIRFPQLLYDGVHFWPTFSPAAPAIVEPRWRNLAVVSTKMEMPPIEEIKKNLYNWEQANAARENRPPIRINLPTGVISGDTPPLPKPKPDTPAPVKPIVPAPSASAGGAAAGAGGIDPARVDTGETKKPGAGGMADVLPKVAPKGIPDTAPVGTNAANPAGSAKSPVPGAGGVTAKETKDPAQQVRAQGNVFFDDHGFNLEDYANIVKERVRQNWLIPSNLRLYQGSATILFYINKDGQVTGARIELSSGNGSLDLSALKAVMDSIPFPILPKGFPAERVGARLVFAYNER